MKLKLIYLDTSSVNKIAKLPKNKQKAIKTFFNSRNYFFVTSEITFIEILRTSNMKQREELIKTCQNIFYDSLLISFNEIIISLINSGKHESFTNKEINNVWKDVINNKRKTCIISDDDLKTIKMYKTFYKAFKTFAVDSLAKLFKYHCNDCSDNINCNMFCNKINRSLSYLLAFSIMAKPVELFSNDFEKFWVEKEIFSNQDKLDFIENNLKGFIENENCPFYLMSRFCNLQYQKGSNIGLLNDCFHSIYAHITDYFVSEDNHFLSIFSKNTISFKGLLKRFKIKNYF